jgi:hypothetical protein
MEKIWFIDIDGKAEGPLSILELKRNIYITPDTLVWKSGFPKWIKIRDVPELKDVFKDDHTHDEDDDDKIQNLQKKFKATGKDELVIDMQRGPSSFFFWLLIAAILISYYLYNTFLT